MKAGTKVVIVKDIVSYRDEEKIIYALKGDTGCITSCLSPDSSSLKHYSVQMREKGTLIGVYGDEIKPIDFEKEDPC